MCTVVANTNWTATFTSSVASAKATGRLQLYKRQKNRLHYSRHLLFAGWFRRNSTKWMEGNGQIRKLTRSEVKLHFKKCTILATLKGANHKPTFIYLELELSGLAACYVQMYCLFEEFRKDTKLQQEICKNHCPLWQRRRVSVLLNYRITVASNTVSVK